MFVRCRGVIFVFVKQRFMKRKIYNSLLRWKNEEKGKVALLVEGARRVGKSFIVEEFAKNEYKSYILVDFAHIGKAMKEVFDEYLNETDTFLIFLKNVAQFQQFAVLCRQLQKLLRRFCPCALML